MKVLVISDNFYPEYNAPAQRIFSFTTQWAKKSADVTVITSFPNFPNGKTYNGYKNKLWDVEYIEGVRVLRVWTFMAANQGILLRTIDHLSFMIAAIIASFWVPGPQKVVGTSPQFFSICAACVISKLKSCPWCLELRDFWPGSFEAVGIRIPRLILKFLTYIESFLYSDADLICTVTQSFRETLIRRGVNPKKIFVITNGVDLKKFNQKKSEFSGKFKNSWERKKFIVGYVGTVGMAHGLEVVVETAHYLQNKINNQDFQFVIAGEGAKLDEISNLKDYYKLKNICILGRVDLDHVPALISSLDVCLVHLRRSKVFDEVIPSKIFEAMAAGTPLCHGVPGESANIVTSLGIGRTFIPGDSGDLVSALTNLKNNKEEYDQMKLACHSAARQYDRTRLAQDYIETLSSDLVHQ